MKLFENGVGRPSNETLKKRRIFVAGIVTAIIAVIAVGVYALSDINVSNLTGKAGDVIISETDEYAPGTKILLSKVKIYPTAKTKISLKRKSGVYYVATGIVQNGRFQITPDAKDNGDGIRITGWIDISVISSKNVSTNEPNIANIVTTNKTTTNASKTTTKKTTKVTYKANQLVNLKGVKVYSTAKTSRVKTTKTGNVYIYRSAKVSNGRIRISTKKNGTSIGWINVSDIKKNNSVSIKVIYQKYTTGQVLQLVKKANNSTNANASKYVFSRATSASSNTENFTVVKNSDEKTATVVIKDNTGNTYTVPKINIAGASAVVTSDNVKTTTYYNTYEEAKASAPTNAHIKDLTATPKTTTAATTTPIEPKNN